VSLSMNRVDGKLEAAQPPQFEHVPSGNAYEFGTMRPVPVNSAGQMVGRLPQRRTAYRRLGSG